jgi:hypothetical protein
VWRRKEPVRASERGKVALGIRRCLAMFQFSVSEFDQQQSEERGRGGGGRRQAAGTEESDIWEVPAGGSWNLTGIDVPSG